ncbi:MAG: UDP-N-acetylglucosamine--N-acetylmuramyl-(pentapeptide) pyrophosphoryl-undecaprenol N-acetylglucosamine transferase, partial [Hyphomicrobium sp.]
METSVLLAAGGTGGHLFPAQALAEELARRGGIVDLVTDMRGDRYGTGFPASSVYQVPAATLAGRSPIQMAHTAWMLGRGLVAAHRLLGKIKPKAVIGFGGYPTFPPIIAARLRGIPTALHEQNAVLGR